jgi:hypothetical protein
MTMDFTRAFGKKRLSRLNFATRNNVNYFHDLIFLSSYLHDALLNTKDIKLNKGIFTMPVERVGWEYYTRLQPNPKGTPGCHSILTVSEVRSIHWSRRRLPPRLEITAIFAGQQQFLKGKAHMVFYCREQGVTMELLGGYELFSVALKDQERPHYNAEQGVVADLSRLQLRLRGKRKGKGK